YGAGQAVLRIKTDMKHPNPAFRDRVLFRISDRVHPRIGGKYRVWPLLEFSWAVDDYALGITHVLRGKDLVIEDEMERFIWSLFGIDAAEFVHYGMLRLKVAKLSKSEMRMDIEKGLIEGIDDPRTWSLQSLRKRGISPQSVRSFILGFGLSMTDIEISAENLYAENRKLIDPTANRYFFVPSPVEIKLAKPPKTELQLPLHPDNKEMGFRTLHIGHSIFVPKEDFDKLQGQEIRLKDFCNIILKPDAEVTSVENKEIPRIQWVSEHTPIKVIMPNGDVVEGYGEKAIKNLKESDVVQFERFGFVRVDSPKDGVCFFAHK
ncbi:MAG: glutamate--tRNA ligase, partial [Thermoplasmata archaeon]|nr:glutamate--tRNA ligase [Thermoplasmata archaeon]